MTKKSSSTIQLRVSDLNTRVMVFLLCTWCFLRHGFLMIVDLNRPAIGLLYSDQAPMIELVDKIIGEQSYAPT